MTSFNQNELDSRSRTILNAALEAYIKTGEPVSSSWLFDHYNFGIKPAMIRHELNYLEEEGYLIQPHHSSGRVPTNKAYELYVRNLLESDQRPKVPVTKSNIKTVDHFKARAWDLLVEHMSDELKALSVVWDDQQRQLYADGLHNVVAHLAVPDVDEIVKIIYDFEQLEKHMRAVSRDAPATDLSVFVGKENPVIGSEAVSAVVASYEMADGGSIYICTVGPKRMNYGKVIGLLQSLRSHESE